MTRIYIAETLPEEKAALRLALRGQMMDVVGEAADWKDTLADAPAAYPDLLLIDSDLLREAPGEALDVLRKACHSEVVIVLISNLDDRQQAACSSGADLFISKSETAERVAEHLQRAAASVRI